MFCHSVEEGLAVRFNSYCSVFQGAGGKKNHSRLSQTAMGNFKEIFTGAQLLALLSVRRIMRISKIGMSKNVLISCVNVFYLLPLVNTGTIDGKLRKQLSA